MHLSATTPPYNLAVTLLLRGQTLEKLMALVRAIKELVHVRLNIAVSLVVMLVPTGCCTQDTKAHGLVETLTSQIQCHFQMPKSCCLG